jgi:aminoglycoside phosphotransferase (APT) family kinase protein
MSRSPQNLGRLLGAGKEAEAFEFGDGVVKLYRRSAPKDSAFREAAHMTLAERAGLPTPEVFAVDRFVGRWGIAMSRVEGVSFADAIDARPERAPPYLSAMALLHLRVHAIPAVHLGGLKARLASNIRRADILGAAAQGRLLEELERRTEGDRLCHGDFHLSNILGPIDRPALLDWLDASRGDPAADVCRSYVLMKPSFPPIAVAYVEQYARASGKEISEILSWTPIVAAARLAEGVERETAALLEMALSI